jgi:hypothetical protein
MLCFLFRMLRSFRLPRRLSWLLLHRLPLLCLRFLIRLPLSRRLYHLLLSHPLRSLQSRSRSRKSRIPRPGPRREPACAPAMPPYTMTRRRGPLRLRRAIGWRRFEWVGCAGESEVRRFKLRRWIEMKTRVVTALSVLAPGLSCYWLRVARVRRDMAHLKALKTVKWPMVCFCFHFIHPYICTPRCALSSRTSGTPWSSSTRCGTCSASSGRCRAWTSGTWRRCAGPIRG